MAASWNNHEEVVKILLSAGAQADLLNKVCYIIRGYGVQLQNFALFRCVEWYLYELTLK